MILPRLIIAFAIFLVACATAEKPEQGSGWLLEAPSDQERFDRLQDYLGGFSSAMWEVGERFDSVYVAIVEENYPLADYHWAKIADAIRGGALKRPAREANSNALFLEGAWVEMRQALDTGNVDTVRAAYESARHACMNCHIAEGVAFMNDQPILRDQTFSTDQPAE